MSQQNISNALLELSEAIEQLALVIAKQHQTDHEHHVKQLAVITNTFKKVSNEIQKPNITAIDSTSQLIQQKHKKSFLRNWLKQKNITIESATDNLRADEKLFKVANYLSEHYLHLNAFYKQLKRSQSLKSNFNFKTNKQAIKYIQNWCLMLHQHKIIDAFNNVSDDEMYVDIAEMHDAVFFIYGYWLEIVLRREVAHLLYKHLENIKSFDFLASTKILKPDLSNTELDLLLMINDKVYWFECKSGQISEYFERYKQTRMLLQLPSEQAFLVIPHIDLNIPLHAKKVSNMKTLFGTQLEEQLQTIFS
ncbi:MAG TPA: hypothetical protein PKD39_12445 [Chitinophagales bacterium]|nr:hypothetical protein [Chitinophagales bacterium]HMZ34914.1 hypothetical protein [Chitinophagales bacterium]HNG72735.1 hypothetical protein [Chitinophagales bacterium]